IRIDPSQANFFVGRANSYNHESNYDLAISRDYAAVLRFRCSGRRFRVIFSVRACSRAHRVVSGVGPEGG
ncbi:MAG TPA: hypothetical protein VN825_05755, partial [Candidatus Acidoferrum sp.]|nr:hypothetical protein [Candidatus Acidoferrum sp.]